MVTSTGFAYTGSTGVFYRCTDIEGQKFLFATNTQNVGVLPHNYPEAWQIFSKPGQLVLRKSSGTVSNAKYDLIYELNSGAITPIAKDCEELRHTF